MNHDQIIVLTVFGIPLFALIVWFFIESEKARKEYMKLLRGFNEWVEKQNKKEE